MTAFETPWFLKSKTTDVGRANQIVEERLQRSVTELEFKARKSLMKIDRRIDTIIEEYTTLKVDVDFSTDLDQHGKPLDPEEVRSKSSSDTRSKRKLKKILNNPNFGSESAIPGYKIRRRKQRGKFSTQDMIEKLNHMMEREEMREWTFSPYMKMPTRVYKLKPIEGVTNKLYVDAKDESDVIDKTDIVKNEIKMDDEIGGIDTYLEANIKGDGDLKLINDVKDVNNVSNTLEMKVKKKKKKRNKKNI